MMELVRFGALNSAGLWPSIEMSSQKSNGSWRHPGNPRGLTERRRTNLGEPVYHLAREAGNPMKDEIGRNSPRFLASLTVDDYGLPA